MKWLLAIIMTMVMGGCSASSAIASQLANDGETRIVQIVQVVEPKQLQLKNLLIQDPKLLTWMQQEVVRKKQLADNRAKLDRVVKKLKKRVGKTPYVFAGSSTYGWDCSGMVRWAYEQLGIELEHSATKQAHAGKRVKEPKVGDIVVFGYKGYKSFYHSAIYIGNGKVVNANSGFKGTYIQPLTDYKGNRIVFVRILDTP